MTRMMPVFGAMTLVLIGGVVHGVLTDRWFTPEIRREMAERVSQLPRRLGDWVGEDLTVAERHQRVADADVIVARRYSKTTAHAGSFDVVLVLFSGRAQPMSVHTPDFCFPNTGYHMDAPARIYNPEVDGQRRHSFWFARFHKAGEAPRRVYWSWSDGQRWRAVDDPRGEFRHRRGLYKLYLVGPMPRTSDDGEEMDDVRVFLDDCLPELQRRLAVP